MFDVISLFAAEFEEPKIIISGKGLIIQAKLATQKLAMLTQKHN